MIFHAKKNNLKITIFTKPIHNEANFLQVFFETLNDFLYLYLSLKTAWFFHDNAW
jgi:hypothetical protein